MALYPDSSIQYVKGVGPRLASFLRKKGLCDLQDLLENYPRTYEDRRAARNIASLQLGDVVHLKVQVQSVSSYSMGSPPRTLHEIRVKDASGVLSCKFFKLPYRGFLHRFSTSQTLGIAGQVVKYRGNLEIHHPDIQEVSENEDRVDEMLPIYPQVQGISMSRLRKVVQGALELLKKGEVKGFGEVFPSWLLKNYCLPVRKETLISIHCPPPRGQY